MKRSLLMVLALILAMTSPALAQQDVGVGAVSVFKNGVDARILAMGGAGVAVADTYSASYWNPAGVARAAQDAVRIGGMNTNLLGAGINFNYAGAAWELFGLPWGASLGMVSITDIPISGGGTGNDTELMGILSSAFPIGTIVIGASGKYYSQQLLDASATGIGFDAGVLISGLLQGLTIGAAGYDLGNTQFKWSTGHVDLVEQLFRVGLAFHTGDITLAVQGDLLAGGTPLIHAGAEFNLFGPVAVRIGAVQMPGTQSDFSFTAGAGLKLGSLGVDFAWLQNKTFAGVEGASDTLVLSFEFTFGGQSDEETPPPSN
jgi:hypothetical protein